MLKKRIIATLTLLNGKVVQSVDFARYLPIGDPGVSVEFLNRWGIDEIVVLDMFATREGRGPGVEAIQAISENGFVPLTVGGGIKTIEDMRALIHSGADKIAINTIAIDTPEIITKGAAVFGDQCIIVSMDVKKSGSGYEVMQGGGAIGTGKDPVTWAKKVEERGAGEILLNVIDQDGRKQGYDIMLAEMVTSAVSIPVIVCGGAGHPEHFLELFKKTSAPAAAAGNFFQFTEQSPVVVKSYLHQKGIDVRLDSYATYLDSDFDVLGRPAKKTDDVLRKMHFEYYPEEVI